MIKLPVFDWFVEETAPFRREEAIVKINYGLTNKVISEEIVVVISLNLKGLGSWEPATEFKNLVDLWIWFIKLVLISHTENLLSTFDDHVGVRKRAHVSRCKVKSLKNIESHKAVLWCL